MIHEYLKNRSIELLQKCINAHYQIEQLQEEYKVSRDRIISNHYPSYETKYGTIEIQTASVENTVIYMLEEEERIKDDAQQFIEHKQLLNDALDTLTIDENSVFNHIVWGHKLSLNISESELQQMSIEINEKLINYLSRRLNDD